MKITTKIAGWDKAIANVNQLQAKLERGIMREAVMKSGRIMAAKARDNAPVKTGALKRSLKIKVKTNTGRGTVTGRIGVSTGEKAAKGAIHPGRYLHLVEYGTSHSPPNGFMRRAFESTKGEVTNRYHAELKAAIPKVAARIHKQATRKR